MNTRQRKRSIWLAAALLALGSAALIAWGLAAPVRLTPPKRANLPSIEPVAANQPDTPPNPANNPPSSNRPALAELTRLTAIDLRKPLYPPETEKNKTKDDNTQPAPPPQNPLTLRLVGTIIEPGHSMAMLQNTRDQSIQLCPEGETIEHGNGKVTVTRVDPHKATVQYAGRSHVLETPRSKKGERP